MSTTIKLTSLATATVLYEVSMRGRGGCIDRPCGYFASERAAARMRARLASENRTRDYGVDRIFVQPDDHMQWRNIELAGGVQP